MAVRRTVRVLVVDDSPTDRFIIGHALEHFNEADFEVEMLPSTKGLRRLLEKVEVDLLLLDYNMPGQTGLDFVRSLPDRHDLPPVIMLTGSGDELVAKEAIRAGAYDYFLKSRIEPEALGDAIIECLETTERDRAARRQKLETERLAVIDPLTDLYNRRYLADALRRECGRLSRYGGNLSCLMIDIDGFKRHNDLHGHLHGDAILKQVATLISASIRDCDIAARYGGDEFCVLLTDTDHEGALKLAERLRASIAEQHLIVEALGITASIGVCAVTGGPALYPEMLIEGADSALRRAKAAGKNQVQANSETVVAQ